jgi:hypothetical protein
MKAEQIEREKCLLKIEETMSGIGTLLKELSSDMSHYNLEACANCKSGLTPDRCKDVHSYLKSIYDNLRSLKAGLQFMK